MNHQEFIRLIETHGSRSTDWPWALRLSGFIRLASDKTSRDFWQQQKAFENQLSEHTGNEKIDPAFLANLNLIPQQYSQVARPDNGKQEELRLFRTGLGWAMACAVIAFCVGSFGLYQPQAESSSVVQLALGFPMDLEISEVLQ